MPFIRRNLSPIGGQATNAVLGSPETVPGSPGMWSYRTADTHATVDTSGYFNEVRTLLTPGDLILVVVINGTGVVQTAGWHVVMTRTATVVNVSDVTVLTVTNTD